jgi:diketogulonate reductase-like aldo/keto reductase
MSYSPLAKNQIGLPAIDVLSWHEDNGFIPVPGTSNLKHLEENF